MSTLCIPYGHPHKLEHQLTMATTVTCTERSSIIFILHNQITPVYVHGFDFIECFTTTFLRAHSWLNWVDEDDDEDEVGLKEKPSDTRLHRNKTRSTGSVDKGLN